MGVPCQRADNSAMGAEQVWAMVEEDSAAVEEDSAMVEAVEVKDSAMEVVEEETETDFCTLPYLHSLEIACRNSNGVHNSNQTTLYTSSKTETRPLTCIHSRHSAHDNSFRRLHT